MAILNIRGVADELHQAVKVRAAQEGLTITEFVVRVLAASVVEVKAGTGVLERQVMPNARKDPAVTGEHRAETSAGNPSKIGQPHHPNCSCVRCKPPKK